MRAGTDGDTRVPSIGTEIKLREISDCSGAGTANRITPLQHRLHLVARLRFANGKWVSPFFFFFYGNTQNRGLIVCLLAFLHSDQKWVSW